MKFFDLPRTTLVLGGAASGKSLFAEQLIQGTGRPRRYIATAEAWDAEMRAKIVHHRAQRGPDWDTVEAPLDLSTALRRTPTGHAVLVDCLTLWLTNHLLAEADLDLCRTDLCATLADLTGPIVLVSNEVGQGIVPDTALSRRFRDAQGQLNRVIAAQADLVVAVIAGLPLALKGRLPEQTGDHQ
ncbi:bifunctional adenosylcobinamide kinase/adenosylcobinamide-phosphate guanylyltransferase [Pseudoruegeria sp. SK021]|uniref:bifunctional adenosylcobinamide kinase/adenosylcobinamide-phosphate guanylyltransferase n=1 Tax=Pseudoruegeria sp. SK021 TaxID=1933035 RepID=UPI000A24C9DC|nr:bifunctional adenosylcobinamide kinase/adenosylcobinamide-phosphate guanylyltransferase [Pseudoruegeria sp. SK021]OSP56063.1 bifunctional adenosylcobinamide kinase/adenosylcobinamide-phosphate guanylyltransferase [Pseudoruegeria sp. SK021]